MAQTRRPAFHVEQKTSLIDERIKIVLDGLPPCQPVKLKASMRDNTGRAWESYAVFKANENGQVDLETQSPLEGTYSYVDNMGLFWSMVRKSSPPTAPTPLAPIKTTLIAEVDDKVIASADIIRNYVDPDVQRIPVQEKGLVGTLFLPPGAERLPSVIVLGGSEGGLMQGRAALLASHGFAALSLAYFAKDHLPKQLINIPVEYIGTAIEWMQSQAAVDPERLAVLGTSKGAELALLCCTLFPQLRAVAAVVPSGVVYRGIGKAEEGKLPSSWSKGGEPLPYASGAIPQEVLDEINCYISTGKPVPWIKWYASQLSDLESVQQATMSVEKIKGPVLLVSGGDDQVWPSGQLSEMVMSRLKQFNYPYPFTHLHYPKAGHAIFPPYYPTTDRSGAIELGGSSEEDAAAQADSWPKIIQFFKESF